MAFERTEQAKRRAVDCARSLDELCAALAPWPDEAASVTRLAKAYRARAAEFFGSGHKFSLAVVGQVKAGKSTFLNTLLFGGQDVLPHAAGPKTSVLTRLEYAPQTSVRVEYYTAADWAALEQAAAVPLDTPAVHGARELVKAVEGQRARRDACAEKGEETFACPDETTLAALLEDTVGGGMLSPFVKCVTLGLCREELRGLSVVDTPGLNDPLPSRSQRTEEFLETCDAAFFLSHAGYFLDDTDIALLTGQLARKSVRRIQLVASRFDGALADAMAADPACTADSVRAALTQRAGEKLDAVLEKLRRTGAAQPVTDAIAACRAPLFVSSAARRMARTAPGAFTPAQQAVAQSVFGARVPDADELEALSGFAQVEAVFRRFIDEKDETLAHKADSFAAVARTEMHTLLGELCAKRTQQMRALAAQEEEMANRGRAAAAEARRIADRAAQLFDAQLAPLEGRLHTAAGVLSQMSGDSAAPVERRDVTLYTQYKTISDATFWKPWTWGRSHREYSVKEAAKSYWQASDTVEFLAAFERDMALLWADLFAPLTDTSHLQSELVRFAQRTLTGQDAEDALPLARRALGRIAAPRLAFSTQAQRESLAAQFPDRVELPAAREALRDACREAVQSAAASAARELDEGAHRFERTVRAAQQEYSARLLRCVNDERRAVEAKRSEAAKKRASCQEFIETAQRMM